MASGDILGTFVATTMRLPDADYARWDSILTSSADEPDEILSVLDFEPVGTNEEYCYITSYMPGHYSGSGITVKLFWTSEATTGDVVWAVAFKSITPDVDNLGTKVFAAPNTATDTTASAAREITETSITFTDGADMDSVAANEMYHMEISRNSSNASDTMNSNDAELHMIVIEET